MNQIVWFLVLDASEVVQADWGEHVDEIIWGAKELVEIVAMLKSKKLLCEFVQSIFVFLLGKLSSHNYNE